MSHRTIRLLVSGDLHLGRFPARAPVSDPDLSAEYVWELIVAYAVDQRVDALVLTGDVVDRENRFFESFGPLRRGLERLAAAGIPSFAVAGNHDFDVLPALHDSLKAKGFHLVGRGGSWETVPLLIGGQPSLFFTGWSFPSPAVNVSPLDDFEMPATELPVIGLVHGDLNQRTSRYAPLALADLRSEPVAAWLLGHIHKPGVEKHRNGIILYPGSPQPLGPKEEGAHGPWLIDVDPSGGVRAEQVPFATLRFGECEVDLEGVASRDEFRNRVIAAAEDHVRKLADEFDSLKHVIYTLRYVGRTSLHREIEGLDLQVRKEIPVGRITASITGSSIEARPALDLENLARGNDPLGVLAKLILDLDAGRADGTSAKLVRRSHEEIDLLQRKAAYSPLRSAEDFPGPDSEAIQQMLRDQALLLLDELHGQKVATSEAEVIHE